MIGKVHFTIGGNPATATLGDDGRWAVDGTDPRTAEVLAEDLNIDLNLDHYSPADGQRGYLQLHQAAERLGGTVNAPEPPAEGTPGVVY